MTTGDFRRLALHFSGAAEGAHHGHADFRVAGKIFATLGYPDPGWAMVKLTPEQQARFVDCNHDCFSPVKGAWGRRGATGVLLFNAKTDEVRRALALAHRNITAALHRSRHQPAHSESPRRQARRAS